MLALPGSTPLNREGYHIMASLRKTSTFAAWIERFVHHLGGQVHDRTACFDYASNLYNKGIPLKSFCMFLAELPCLQFIAWPKSALTISDASLGKILSRPLEQRVDWLRQVLDFYDAEVLDDEHLRSFVADYFHADVHLEIQLNTATILDILMHGWLSYERKGSGVVQLKCALCNEVACTDHLEQQKHIKLEGQPERWPETETRGVKWIEWRTDKEHPSPKRLRKHGQEETQGWFQDWLPGGILPRGLVGLVQDLSQPIDQIKRSLEEITRKREMLLAPEQEGLARKIYMWCGVTSLVFFILNEHMILSAVLWILLGTLLFVHRIPLISRWSTMHRATIDYTEYQCRRHEGVEQLWKFFQLEH